MTDVTEHDGEQKGEGHDGVQSCIKNRRKSLLITDSAPFARRECDFGTWIGLAIRCHSIGIDQFLESFGELVGPVVGGWHLVRVNYL